jgi:sn-glycerol 3-phosphate transport system ATP-binding protein
MNILPLADGPGGAVVKGTAGPVILAGAGAGLALGLRPEEVTLSHGLPPDGAALAAEVVGIEYLGADTIVSLRVGSERAAVRMAGAVALERGSAARLAWRPAAVHLFELASGARSLRALEGASEGVRRFRA